jgi:CarboxypepD_reg-like domain
MENSWIKHLNSIYTYSFSYEKSFTLSIPTPCHEQWSESTPTEKGAFCGACQKEVIDFTQCSEEQIKDYFIHATRNTCGRFYVKRLITYEETSKPARSWWMAPLLALILLIVSRPALAQQKVKIIYQEQVDKKTIPPNKSDLVKHEVIIRGMVRSSDDSLGMPRVNVIRKGSAEGTVTDANGKFELTILVPKRSEILQFSFVGFINSEQNFLINKPIVEKNVVLNFDDAILSETTVIAGGICIKPHYRPCRPWWKIKGVFKR